ncbi:hypothetical protein [Curtobacterium herbarum]|uniref:hypothetical protein n=1 Tax=Curtobacterium herbarum TaxID=150122 RepID=UPI00195C1FA2|nr:hypothetical protein [Curtobacterium herbarum]MBM7476367.1 hypothetical protein [Curtobacterium herbarum]MCS6544067.1 hypothetical protein [Curtobacterium herbarum]
MTEAPLPSGTTRRRVELRLHEPWFAWGARPTVVVDGVSQPAQWGSGTWALPDAGSVEFAVFGINRRWRFGAASVRVDAAAAAGAVIEYRAGALPFGPGTLVVRG